MRVDPSGKPAEARGDTPECLGSTSGSCSSTPQTEGGDPFRATPGGGGGSASSSSGAGVRLDPETGLPPEQVWRPLFDLFFVVLGQHFPSISKPILERRIQCGIMSTFFLLAICAITLPYSPLRQELAPNGGNPFVDKANELLVPLLRFPAYDTTTALLLLAWCEFRENYDSGFWQFTGMAIRMAFDLGINTNQDEVYDDGAHAKRTHLLFWTIFIIDRVISFFTGRPVTIAESMCEIPLPVEEEFIGIEGVDSPSLDDLLRRPRQPFPYVVRLMVLCGRLSDALNGLRRGLVAGSLPDSDRTRLVEAAKAVQIDLLHFYETLPLDLAWSTENFKIQAGACQGGLLLMIHLWANALLLLAHKPELLHKMMSDPNIPSLGPRRTFECIKVISDCIVFADLFSSVSLTATPHVCLPLAVAALAFVSELQACNGRLEMSGPQEGGSGRESARTPTFAATSGIASSSLQSLPRPSSSGLNQSTPLLQMDPVDSFRMMMLQQNVSVAVKGLRMMEKYWGAVKAVLTQLAVHCERAGVTGLDFSSDPEETESRRSPLNKGSR
ncbi:putative pathway-specific nitrogen regulator [Zopfochytrium polystomum]|nr:putative pathway-specific nitrogen regulator [Zopfochytrium polystomum]